MSPVCCAGSLNSSNSNGSGSNNFIFMVERRSEGSSWGHTFWKLFPRRCIQIMTDLQNTFSGTWGRKPDQTNINIHLIGCTGMLRFQLTRRSSRENLDDALKRQLLLRTVSTSSCENVNFAGRISALSTVAIFVILGRQTISFSTCRFVYVLQIGVLWFRHCKV